MRILLVVTIALSLQACFFFKEKKEKPNELTEITRNVVIKERWGRTVGKGLGELYQLVQPAVSIDTVFANDIYGRIYAYNRETGKLKWKNNLKIDLSAGVGLGDTLVLVGSLEGDVVALNKADGKEVWRTNIASEILAPPQTNNQVVVVQTNEGRLYGLNAETGKFLWRYTTKLPLLTLRGTATPQVFGNNLITGFANGKIVALSTEDGALYWERRVAYPEGLTQLDRVVDVDGSPVIHGDTVYSTSFNGHITAIAPDGRLRWTQKVSSHQTPLVVGDRVFVTAADGTLHAYHAKTGLPLWKNSLLLNRKISAPQELSDFVVVSDFKGYVHVFDPELGTIIGRGKFDGDGIRSPMVSDDTYLYILGNEGELSVVSLHLSHSDN